MYIVRKTDREIEKIILGTLSKNRITIAQCHCERIFQKFRNELRLPSTKAIAPRLIDYNSCRLNHALCPQSFEHLLPKYLWSFKVKVLKAKHAQYSKIERTFFKLGFYIWPRSPESGAQTIPYKSFGEREGSKCFFVTFPADSASFNAGADIGSAGETKKPSVFPFREDCARCVSLRGGWHFFVWTGRSSRTGRILLGDRVVKMPNLA